MARLINKDNPRNRKCEYCTNFQNSEGKLGNNDDNCKCGLTGEAKHYWNRCKNFAWRPDRMYLQDQPAEQAN